MASTENIQEIQNEGSQIGFDGLERSLANPSGDDVEYPNLEKFQEDQYLHYFHSDFNVSNKTGTNVNIHTARITGWVLHTVNKPQTMFKQTNWSCCEFQRKYTGNDVIGDNCNN